MKIVFVFLLATAFSVEALDFNYQLTGSNASILIIESAIVSSPIPEGSTLGAFYTDVPGLLICAGTATWTNNTSVGFPIWGSGGVFDNGFSEGE